MIISHRSEFCKNILGDESLCVRQNWKPWYDLNGPTAESYGIEKDHDNMICIDCRTPLFPFYLPYNQPIVALKSKIQGVALSSFDLLIRISLQKQIYKAKTRIKNPMLFPVYLLFSVMFVISRRRFLWIKIENQTRIRKAIETDYLSSLSEFFLTVQWKIICFTCFLSGFYTTNLALAPWLAKSQRGGSPLQMKIDSWL